MSKPINFGLDSCNNRSKVWMDLIDAGPSERLDRYIGYYESYAESHDVLDNDKAVQDEVRNIAKAVAKLLRRFVKEIYINLTTI